MKIKSIKFPLIGLCVFGFITAPFINASAKDTTDSDTQHATAALSAGDVAFKKRRYAVAADEYKLATDLLPDAPATSSLRRRAISSLGEATVRLAELRITEGRYEDAKTATKVALAYDPNYKPAIELLAHLEDPSNSNPGPHIDIDKEHAVEKLFTEATVFYDTGRFDLALKRFDQILNLDPYNLPAKKGREMALIARQKYAEEHPNAVGHIVAMPPPSSTPASSAVDDINKKLNHIIIPKLTLKDAKVSDVVEFLHKRSIELDTTESDPARKGVNIVLKLDSTPEANATPPPHDSPLWKPPGDKRITLSLTNIPLTEALRYVSELAGLKINIESYGVILTPHSNPNPTSTNDSGSK